jgi:diguanylate cyclase (GGDEF)-like protein/PAS domain S-box-containing protein
METPPLEPRSPALRIAAAYAAFATLWIVTSDALVSAVVTESEAVLRLQSWKGTAFVAVTTLLLYGLVRRYTRRLGRSEERLAETARQYRELFTSSPEPMWIYDAETFQFLAVNEAAVSRYGWSREEFLRLSIADIRPAEELAKLRQHLESVADGPQPSGVWRHRWRNGEVREVEVTSHSIEFDGRRARFVVAHDVTSERFATRRLERLSRLYATASATARATVRLTERERAFPELCSIVVDSGRLCAAEVRLIERHGSQSSSRRAAGAGALPADDVLLALQASGALDVTGADAQIIRELAAVAPQLATAGRCSLARIPLRENGLVIGALLVYADEPDWFDAEVCALLEQIAEEISFTLDGLLREAKRAATESALVESESRFRHLLHSVGDVAWSATLDGSRLLYVNAAVEEIYGRPTHEFYENPELWFEVIHPDDLERVRAGNERMHALGRADYEHRILRPDGAERWVHSRTVVVADGEGRPLRIGGLLSDITQRKKAERELELAAAVFEKSREVIMVTDAQRRLLAVNPAFEELSGYRAEEVLGADPRLLKSGRQDDAFYASMWRDLAANDYWHGELWNRHKSGRMYPQWTAITAVRGADGAVSNYIAIGSDLTDRKQAEASIERLQWFDVVTGLPNRAQLRVRVQASLAQLGERGYALLHIGLDRFHAVNESLGHAQGDVVLRQIAQRLVAAAPQGSLLARIDGDEFALWIEGGETDRALEAADGLRAAVRAPLEVDGQELSLTACIGVSCAPRDAGELDSLMRFAAAALTRAKASSRDVCEFYQPALNAAVCEQLELESALRLALPRGEFALHYQPQVDLRDGRILGFEALLRWNRPGHPSISPAQFVPIAERCGLIVGLGAWVLDEACRQAREWRDSGLASVRIAVNVSAAQVVRADLVGTVRGALDKHGLPPHALELEVTESALVVDVAGVVERLDALAELGVELALDDFGTGYSNLSYLKRFPLQRLKLDRSFVTHVVEDDYDDAIARAVVAVGQALGLDVLAEGIETVEQAEHLRGIGCVQGQGYLYSRPLAARDVPNWVALHEAAHIAPSRLHSVADDESETPSASQRQREVS